MKPTAKEIIHTFNHLEVENHRKIIKIINGRMHQEDLDYLCARWLSQCFNRPSPSELEMHAIDNALGHFGVEYIKHNGTRYLYSNSGDSYAATIFLNLDTLEYSISSIGDMIEA